MFKELSLYGTDDSYLCSEHGIMDKPVKSLSCNLKLMQHRVSTVLKKVSLNKEKRVLAAELFELTTTDKTNRYKTT